MTFEDLHEFKNNGYYLVPNEGTVAWRKLVKGLRIDRAAGICSSGEVGLIAMLPTVRKELVLVDHSYASLSVAMLKYVMLRELGGSETRRLLTHGGSPEDLQRNITKFLDKLPKEVQEAYNNVIQVRNSDGGFVVNSVRPYVNYNKVDPKTGWYEETFPDDPKPIISTKLTREWELLPKRDILRCAAKLGKVKFLHGDLSDLVERGPFDLLYLSNAISHSGRKGKINLGELTKCLRPGGYVLAAHHGDPKATTRVYNDFGGLVQAAVAAKWEFVDTTNGGSMGWQQTLYRTPLEQEVAA